MNQLNQLKLETIWQRFHGQFKSTRGKIHYITDLAAGLPKLVDPESAVLIGAIHFHLVAYVLYEYARIINIKHFRLKSKGDKKTMFMCIPSHLFGDILLRSKISNFLICLLAEKL